MTSQEGKDESNTILNNEEDEEDEEEEEGIKLKTADNFDEEDEEYEEGDENDHHKGSVPLAEKPKEGPLGRLKRNLTKYPDLLGFILVGISTILFSLSSMTVKYISKKFSAYEIVFFRCTVQFTLGSIMVVASVEKKEKPYIMGHLDKRITPLLMARGFFGSIAMTLTFLSLHYLSLSDSVLIGFLGPVFTAIWGFIILREKSSILEAIGFCFSFIGITLVARPPFLLKLFHMDSGDDLSTSFSSSVSEGDGGSSATNRTLGIIAGLGYAVFSGLACVFTRKVGNGVHTMVVVNWLSFFGIIVPIPIMTFATGFVMPHGTDWLYLIAIGCITTLAQLFLTLGLRSGTAGRVTIANYLQILWSIVLEIIFLHSYPHWLSLIGACFILFNAGIAIYKAAKVKTGQNKSGNKSEKKMKYVKIDTSREEEEDEDEESSSHNGANEDENESGIQMNTLSK